MPHILTQLRERNGYTQEELANALGISRQHIAKVERGAADLKLAQARLCAEIFNISIDSLSLGEIPMEESVDSAKVRNGHKEDLADERDPRPQLSLDPARVQKFKEVLLYILEKVGAKPNVGKTVLFKLLYFIDFDFYEREEEQLIGATYRKIAYGPAPVEFGSVIADMIANNEIQEVRGNFHGKEQIKYLPLRSYIKNCIPKPERDFIDFELERLSDKTATEISEFSHKDVPWKVHEMGEVIDYESVFYRDAEFSQSNNEDEL